MTETSLSPVDKAKYLALTIYQMICNGSDYNHSTMYPFVACVQLLLQRPLVICTYARVISETTGAKGVPHLIACSSDLVHIPANRRAMEALFSSTTSIDAAIERYGVFSPASPAEFGKTPQSGESDGEQRAFKKVRLCEYLFCLFDITTTAPDTIELTPLERGSETLELLREFIQQIDASPVNGQLVKQWLAEIQSYWVWHFRQFLNRPAQYHVPCKRRAQSDPDYAEGRRILFDIFEGLYARMRQSPLATRQSMENRPAVLFATRVYGEEMDAGDYPSRLMMSADQARDIEVDPARRALGVVSAEWGALVSELTNADLSDACFWVRDAFSSGNITISPPLRPSGTDTLADRWLTVCERVGNTGYPLSLLICPVWLSGVPYAVFIFPLPSEPDNRIGDPWLHRFLLYSELVKANLARRVRARIRDRYAERIFDMARHSWTPALSLNGFSEVDRPAILKKCLDSFDNAVLTMARLFPFKLPQIIPQPQASQTLPRASDDPQEDYDWLGRFGEQHLFLGVQRHPFVESRFLRAESFLRFRGKNALRRGLRDSRLRFVELLLQTRASCAEHAALKALVRHIGEPTALTVIVCRPGSPMSLFISEIAYAVHLRRAFGTGEDRIRLYAPGLCPAEDSRYTEHIVKGRLPGSPAHNRLLSRTDTVVLFLDAVALYERTSARGSVSGKPTIRSITGDVEMLLGEEEHKLKIITVYPSTAQFLPLTIDPRHVMSFDADEYYEAAVRQKPENITEQRPAAE